MLPVVVMVVVVDWVVVVLVIVAMATMVSVSCCLKNTVPTDPRIAIKVLNDAGPAASASPLLVGGSRATRNEERPPIPFVTFFLSFSPSSCLDDHLSDNHAKPKTKMHRALYTFATLCSGVGSGFCSHCRRYTIPKTRGKKGLKQVPADDP